MLKVPFIIERAYRTIPGDTSYGLTGDQRHKEIRIHFPNGEIRDLWNYDIVQESFSFTESVCSADVLKFGLCEAAEVTFEVVGVKENFAGCKIEVFYEIDVSDLEEDYQCAGRYISDPPEGVDKDGNNCNRSIGDEVERGVYSIPIGTFTVIECTRSKSDMNHRSVRAITKVFETNDDMTPFEIWRLEQYHKNKTFNMVIPQYIDAQVAMVGTDNDYTKTGQKSAASGSVKDACYKGKVKLDSRDQDAYVAEGFINFPGDPPEMKRLGQIYISLTCSYTSDTTNDCLLVDGSTALPGSRPYEYTSKFADKEIYHMDSIYLYDCFNDQSEHLVRDPNLYRPEKGVDNFIKYLYDFLYNFVPYSGSSDHPYRNYAEMLKDDTMIKKDEIKRFFNNRILTFGIKYGSDTNTKKGNFFKLSNNEYIMPYDSGENIVGRAIFPVMLTLFLWKGQQSGTELIIPIVCDYTYGVLQPLPIIREGSSCAVQMDIYKRNTGEENVPPEIKLKFDYTGKNPSATTYKYNFTNAFTMRDIINGYLEIGAMFGHQKRNGKYEYMKLKGDGSDKILYKNDFEKVYFDEFDIDEVGYVIYKYKKNKDDKEVEVIYDLETGGTSVYDMTDNVIFSILDEDESTTDKQLRTKIENYLKTYFKPNLGIVHYYPAEIVAHAKPYLEAGDRYKIMLNASLLEEESFITYNLNMNMNGIQNFTTEIVSTSGQLIDGTTLNSDEEEDDT